MGLPPAASGDGPDRVLLLLAGQGAQHPGMAAGLYDIEPVFTAAMDALFTAMGAEGRRVRADWLDPYPRVSLDDASRAQPLLFAVDYALADSLRSAGLAPSRLLGHSIGELAAAALADVFDLPAAGQMLLARSAAMAQTQPGGMLAVAASAAEVAGLLATCRAGDLVAVAAVNAPRQTVLAGPTDALAATAVRLTAAGLAARPVRARQGFHSPVAATALPALRRAFTRLTLRAPKTPIFSSRTGRLVSPTEATSPAFWADQLATPVLFWPALGAALDGPPCTVIGAGPARELAVLARRHPAARRGRVRVVELAAPGPGESALPWLASVAELGGTCQPAAPGLEHWWLDRSASTTSATSP